MSIKSVPTGSMESIVVAKDIRFVLVSDLDHTLVNHSQQNHQDLLNFNRIWHTHFASDSLLVYSTGRSPLKYDQLKTHAPMITPDVVVCSVGSEIYWRHPTGYFILDKSFEHVLDSNWDRNTIAQLVQGLGIDQLILQEQSEQRPHKLSFNLETTGADTESIIKRLTNVLDNSGLDVKFIYSGNKFIDILPKGAGKGRALEYLLAKLREWGCNPAMEVQVNGDSGNDINLFEVEGVKGCAVRNSMEELIQWIDNHPSNNFFIADEDCSAGIVQGMKQFGYLTQNQDAQKKIRNDILVSLEGRFSKHPTAELKISDSFIFHFKDEEIDAKDGQFNLPALLNIDPDSLVLIDRFKVTMEDSSSQYLAIFEIHDLSSSVNSNLKLSGVLSVHMEADIIVWDELHLKYEHKHCRISCVWV